MLRRSLLPLAMLPWAGKAQTLADNANPSGVVLSITGRLDERHGKKGWAIDMPTLARMPHTRYPARTPWYGKARSFSGPLLRDLLQAAGARPQGPDPAVRALAVNDYRVDIPLTDAMRYDVIVARLIDDEPIPLRDRGPLMIMYPFDSQPGLRNAVYYGRCAWQLQRLDLL